MLLWCEEPYCTQGVQSASSVHNASPLFLKTISMWKDAPILRTKRLFTDRWWWTTSPLLTCIQVSFMHMRSVYQFLLFFFTVWKPCTTTLISPSHSNTVFFQPPDRAVAIGTRLRTHRVRAWVSLMWTNRNTLNYKQGEKWLSPEINISSSLYVVSSSVGDVVWGKRDAVCKDTTSSDGH